MKQIEIDDNFLSSIRIEEETERFTMRVSPNLKAKLRALAKYHNFKSEAALVKALINLSYEKIHKKIN